MQARQTPREVIPKTPQPPRGSRTQARTPQEEAPIREILAWGWAGLLLEVRVQAALRVQEVAVEQPVWGAEALEAQHP